MVKMLEKMILAASLIPILPICAHGRNALEASASAGTHKEETGQGRKSRGSDIRLEAALKSKKYISFKGIYLSLGLEADRKSLDVFDSNGNEAGKDKVASFDFDLLLNKEFSIKGFDCAIAAGPYFNMMEVDSAQDIVSINQTKRAYGPGISFAFRRNFDNGMLKGEVHAAALKGDFKNDITLELGFPIGQLKRAEEGDYNRTEFGLSLDGNYKKISGGLDLRFRKEESPAEQTSLRFLLKEGYSLTDSIKIMLEEEFGKAESQGNRTDYSSIRGGIGLSF